MSDRRGTTVRGRYYPFVPVPTLRTFCLIKVLSLDLPHDDLPPELTKDLRKMKNFNRNYGNEFISNIGEQHHTTLTVHYDGVSWDFQTRCFSFFPDYSEGDDSCHHELNHFTVREKEEVDFDFPLCEVRSWANNCPPIKLEIQVNLDEENKTAGTILFLGSSKADDSTVIIGKIAVKNNADGKRMLDCQAAKLDCPEKLFNVVLGGSACSAVEDIDCCWSDDEEPAKDTRFYVRDILSNRYSPYTY